MQMTVPSGLTRTLKVVPEGSRVLMKISCISERSSLLGTVFSRDSRAIVFLKFCRDSLLATIALSSGVDDPSLFTSDELFSNGLRATITNTASEVISYQNNGVLCVLVKLR